MSRARMDFLQRARKAINTPGLQTALDNNAERRKIARCNGYASLPMGLEATRELAHTVRLHAVQNLEEHLAALETKLIANGFIVHRAADGAEAARIVLEIARTRSVKTAAKAKSMVSEEVHLNRALEEAGIRAVETDLGEYIVQLRGEPPAHILTPAVHLRREDVAHTFAQILNVPYTTDVKAMTEVARRRLREVFLESEMGISGVNLAIAETGSLCLCTNEGNGRMVTTLPRVHVALMGIERLVPRLDDLDVILKLLPRSGTGQKLTNSVSLIQHPRREADADGPEERHVILLDNGRLRIKNGPLQEMLLCIRCGACLNVCPVFREVGGHAYASAYPGPIGSLVSPGLFGLASYGHLAKVSSLCGACTEVCPVKVPFSTLLPRLRDLYVRQEAQPLLWRAGMAVYARIVERAWAFRLAQKAGAVCMHLLPQSRGWIKWLPAPLNEWTRARHFPPFQSQPFRERFKKHRPAAHEQGCRADSAAPVRASVSPAPPVGLTERFAAELRLLEGEFIPCTEADLAQRILEILGATGCTQVVLWRDLPGGVCERLREAGLEILDGDLPRCEPQRTAAIRALAKAQAGISGCTAALADTGTLVVPSGAGRLLTASLLPPVHLAVLRKEDIHAGLPEWLDAGGRDMVESASALALISGPSRTADIEMTLTIGMHGPGRVIVFCI